MSDDLDQQLQAYFESLAAHVVPPAAPPEPPPGGSAGRHSTRTPMLIGAALFVVVLVVIGIGVVRSDSSSGPADSTDSTSSTDSTVGTVAEGSSCASIPVALVPRMIDDPPPPIAPDEVLLFKRTTNAMSSFDEPVLVIGSNGSVVALDFHSGPGGLEYGTGTLTSDSLEAVRSCLSSPAYQSLDADYLNEQSLSGEGDQFCGVADASTWIFATGPAGGEPKTVSVYGLDASTGPGRGCDLGRPEVLTDLAAATDTIQDLVGQTGTRTTPPANDLDPNG